jgi:tetratricopeptide (TPR) repeat protein
LALYLLGCLNAEKSDFNQAKRWFKKVERLAPDFANIHEWKGHIFLQLGEISAAEDEYKISTKVKGSVYNHNMLGKIYALQEKWDLAMMEFQYACKSGAEILKSSADSSTLTPAGERLDQSIKERPAPGIENSRAFEKEEIRNAHILLARIYYEKKEYEKSIRQVDRLKSEILNDIQQNSMAQLYNDIAWKYAEAGESLDKALELCQRALDLGSSHPELVYDTKAWVYLKRGNLKEAREQIKNALEIAPDNEGLKRHLSLIQSAIQGELKEIDMQKIK